MRKKMGQSIKQISKKINQWQCQLTGLLLILLPTLTSAMQTDDNRVTIPIWSSISTLHLKNIETTTYTLKLGESAKSIAQKFHMNVEALKFLNQSRFFPNGFDMISDGDEILVPIKPLKLFQPQVDNNNEIQLAKLASQTGKFLADRPNRDKFAELSRNLVASQASSDIQKWLSGYGNARIKLDLDKTLSLKNSQIDLLFPIKEKSSLLWFTQSSLHRTNKRSQANLGMGLRYFGDNYMAGGNTFFDHDFSRYHSRFGVGLEYWRNYLKFDFNTYIPLSDWRDSKDLTKYRYRPAQGWDVKAQGYLPVHPQLGGKLQYERYYGEDVALFGKSHRQKDPYAVTAGVNYSPVPLITLNAEHRVGRNKEQDSQVGLALNYHLGVPWERQLDPNSLSARRSVMGSRYDFVSRNNSIIQEYRKKEIIRLRTTSTVFGHTGERYSLGVFVNSTNGLDKIVWDSSEIENYGGQLIRQSTDQYSIVLPEFDHDSSNNNTYTISAIAYDKKGNVSNRVHTLVIVTPSNTDKLNHVFISTH